MALNDEKPLKRDVDHLVIMGKNQDLAVRQGALSTEEFLPTLSNLVSKLVESGNVMEYPFELVAPISEYIQVSGIRYKPSSATVKELRKEIEQDSQRIVNGAAHAGNGRIEPWWGLEKLIGKVLIAHQLGVEYEIDHGLMDVVDFELHHFDYEGAFEKCDTLLPLDLLYFAKLQGHNDLLESRLINPLDARCNSPLIREATRDEVQQRLQEISEEYCEEFSSPEEGYAIEALEAHLRGKRPKFMRDLMNAKPAEGNELLQIFVVGLMNSHTNQHWENENGEVLYIGKAASIAQRRTPKSNKEIKQYLGSDLESQLKRYCEKGEQETATLILYRRNRVKDILGGDIKIPSDLAVHDGNGFSSMKPEEILMWVDNMVTVWGTSDIYSELALPTSISKKEYRVYRVVKKAMEYIRQGVLTYDTPEKRAMLPQGVLPQLVGNVQLLLPPATAKNQK